MTALLIYDADDDWDPDPEDDSHDDDEDNRQSLSAAERNPLMLL